MNSAGVSMRSCGKCNADGQGALNRQPASGLLHKLAQCDLPNLWKPRPDQFFHIDAMPFLGTGKLDLRKAREIAAARSAEHG